VATPASRLFAVARDLAPFQRETGAWIVVNDRVDVALAAGAKAIHLRARSLPIDDARRIAPALAVGVSVHDTEGAERARSADWLFGGAVYETSSHPGQRGRGDEFVRELVGTGARIIAIGGVRPEHVAHLRSLGVWGVAAVSGIWEANDPSAAARRYL
jgi:thiamine-phosphate diphosphorylase